MNINNNNQNSTGIDTIKKDLENQSKKWKEKLKKKKKNMLRYSYNIKMTHQKGMSLDLINSYSSDDARNIKINYNKNNDDNDLDKFNKSKNLFNQDIFEEVKEFLKKSKKSKKKMKMKYMIMIIKKKINLRIMVLMKLIISK